jgi:hypothetical protein
MQCMYMYVCMYCIKMTICGCCSVNTQYVVDVMSSMVYLSVYFQTVLYTMIDKKKYFVA